METETEIEPDDEATADECLDEAKAIEEDRLAWVEKITTFLGSRFHQAGTGLRVGGQTSDESIGPRVQYALDRAAIAACERLVRIFGSDIDVAPSQNHGEDA